MHKDLLPELLHLYHAFGNRQIRLRRLLEFHDHDPARLRAADSGELRAIGARERDIVRIGSSQQRAVDSDLRWAEQSGNHLISYRDAHYPALLREITDCPLLLYARGNPELLQRPQIAIVGSRRATPGGERHASEFAAAFAAAGIAVTSGMALGIDSAAHRGALRADGATLAVLGTGIDVIYPPRNRELFAEIAERGLVITEFARGSAAHAACFPQRNRIISGLSLATLVIEAAARSGSLITARLAAEQGREVFALPGSISNPQTRGCHQLIRDGAALVETPGEITRELASLFDFVFSSQPAPSPPAPDLEPGQRDLLQHMGYDPVGFDALAKRSGLTSAELSSMLVALELKDLIQPVPGGCFVRI